MQRAVVTCRARAIRSRGAGVAVPGSAQRRPPEHLPMIPPCLRVRAGRQTDVRQRILARHVRIQRIRVPWCNDLVENVPNRVAISVGGRPDFDFLLVRKL